MHEKDKRKKTKRMTVVKSKWRPVPVDINTIQDEDMIDFAGLEEITNYNTVQFNKKGGITEKRFIFEDSNEEYFEDSSDDSPENELDMQTAVKSKKRKRQEDSLDQEKPKKKLKKKKKPMKSDLTVKNVEPEGPKMSDDEIAGEMHSWDGLFVPTPVLRALWELEFRSPTHIQALCLPSAIRDRMDILGAAQTGSGKTLAFGIPIIHSILDAKSRQTTDEKKLYALVLTPTRELAIQVKEHLEAAAKHTSIKAQEHYQALSLVPDDVLVPKKEMSQKVAVIVGGMAPEKQRRIIKRGPDIVVATPGRLWELYEEGIEHLNHMPYVKHLVIDEADRMAEKGHFAELQNIIGVLKRDQNTKRQTYVFSATLTLTHGIPRRMLLKRRKKKITENMKLESIMKLLGMQNKPKIIDLSPKVGTAETLTETRIYCDTIQKDAHLYYFWLSHPGRTIVFCNSIDCVRRLQSVFELLDCKPLCLHASMQQRQRLKNLDRFKTRDRCLLLASDVAARGLDISNIQHVVHYQVPRTAEIYVHRSGRTARAQKEGLSVMLISPEEVPLYKRLSNTLNREGELPEFPVDHGVYSSLHERMSCARQLDKLLHTQSKAQAQSRWLQQAAEAFEIDIEEDHQLSKVMSQNKASTKNKQQVQALKKKLQSLLQKNISPPGYFSRYPTQTGSLVCLKSRSKKPLVGKLK